MKVLILGLFAAIFSLTAHAERDFRACVASDYARMRWVLKNHPFQIGEEYVEEFKEFMRKGSGKECVTDAFVDNLAPLNTGAGTDEIYQLLLNGEVLELHVVDDYYGGQPFLLLKKFEADPASLGGQL